jgi:cell division protein FtsQ
VIVKRKRPGQPQWPRTIVKRSRHTVGEKRARLIVRRGGVRPPGGGGGWRPSFPRWRPRKGQVVLAATLGALLFLAGGVFWVWQSPFFEVSHVEVEGADRISRDTIVEKAGLLGESMFTADLATAQKNLYELPLVYAVRVERSWPNTVKIKVEERKAWGTWEQAGVRYTIDRDGVVLGTAPPPEGSPVIRSSELTTRRQGDRVDYQAVDAAAEIYERLPRQLGTTVAEVAFLAGKGVQVTTADGQSALLGDSSSIAYKLAVWAAMAHQAQVRGLDYTTIDLRFGNRPVLQ